MAQRSGPTGFYRQALGNAHDLVCDGVPLAAIAAAEGTPLYVYSARTLRDRYREIDQAFADYPHALHYALKANSTLAIARLLRELGSAVDANSVWEIEVARRATSISHTELASTALPSSRSRRAIASVEFAFNA